MSPPAHSNGRRSVSCHTGLNPLFLTELVRIVVVVAAVAAGVDDPDAGADVCRCGEVWGRDVKGYVCAWGGV